MIPGLGSRAINLERLCDFVMQVDTVAICAELCEANDTSCRLVYCPSGVGPDREWQRLPCRSLPGVLGVCITHIKTQLNSGEFSFMGRRLFLKTVNEKDMVQFKIEAARVFAEELIGVSRFRKVNY